MYTLQLSKFPARVNSGNSLLFLSHASANRAPSKESFEVACSIVGPYALEFKARDENLMKVEKYYEILLSELTNALNQIHSERMSKRDWEILIGHWLRRYLEASVYSLGKIQLAFETFNINSVVIDQYPVGTLSPLDTGDFTRLMNNPDWMLAFHSKICEVLLSNVSLNPTKEINFQTTQFEQLKSIRFDKSISFNPHNFRRKLLNLIIPFSRNVFTSTYLPRKIEWGLALLTMSIPQGLRFQKPSRSISFNLSSRNNLSQILSSSKSDNLELAIFIEAITDFVPRIFLEGFKDSMKDASRIKGRKTPKYIFTSNDFDSNEFFKFWLVNKIGLGSKYIVGQHGNMYGTSKYYRNTIEEKTADLFISWGWHSQDPKYISGFIFKNPKGKTIQNNPQGGFLLTQLHYPIPNTTWDSDFEFEVYLESLNSFFLGLKSDVLRQMKVRPHPAQTRLGWNDIDYWKLKNPFIELDTGMEKISSLYPKYRLIVHGYDSTGILETLSLNYPTLGYLPNGIQELRSEAQSLYLRLIEGGILHTSPESLSSKLNSIASDVELWWSSTLVQNCRTDFIDTYARSIKSPIRFLRTEVFK
jgi:putative transferase (TIGR04331 family)